MKPAREVLSSGYVALDVMVSGATVRQRAGGTATNVAANLRFLGWRSALLGRLGSDAPGRRILSDLRQSGVDTRHIETSPEVETPAVVHIVDPPSHRFAFSCPSCGRSFPRHRPISPGWYRQVLAQALVKPPEVFFLDRASGPAVGLAKALREKGTQIVFEPSTRGHKQLTIEAANIATVLKCNSDDLEYRLRERLFELRPGQLQIESLGAEGVRFRRDSQWRVSPAIEVPVKESAGAGDWLTAAFLDAVIVTGGDLPSAQHLQRALDDAQAVAALNCCYIGTRAVADMGNKRFRTELEAMSDGDYPSSTTAKIPGRRSRAAGVCRMCLGPKRR